MKMPCWSLLPPGWRGDRSAPVTPSAPQICLVGRVAWSVNGMSPLLPGEQRV